MPKGTMDCIENVKNEWIEWGERNGNNANWKLNKVRKKRRRTEEEETKKRFSFFSHFLLCRFCFDSIVFYSPFLSHETFFERHLIEKRFFSSHFIHARHWKIECRTSSLLGFYVFMIRFFSWHFFGMETGRSEKKTFSSMHKSSLSRQTQLREISIYHTNSRFAICFEVMHVRGFNLKSSHKQPINQLSLFTSLIFFFPSAIDLVYRLEKVLLFCCGHEHEKTIIFFKMISFVPKFIRIFGINGNAYITSEPHWN